MSLCVYAYGPLGDCLDNGCRSQGGRCKYVGPPGRTACRCNIAAPSPNRSDSAGVTAMEPELILYRQQIDEQPLCVDPPFQEYLSRYRAGDEIGARWISGSCLRIAYEIAMNMDDPPPALDLFDRIEEANAALMYAIKSFGGSSADEFIPYARQAIKARLELWRGKAA